jgi:hypothetical protein
MQNLSSGMCLAKLEGQQHHVRNQAKQIVYWNKKVQYVLQDSCTFGLSDCEKLHHVCVNVKDLTDLTGIIKILLSGKSLAEIITSKKSNVNLHANSSTIMDGVCCADHELPYVLNDVLLSTDTQCATLGVKPLACNCTSSVQSCKQCLETHCAASDTDICVKDTSEKLDLAADFISNQIKIYAARQTKDN